MSGLSVRFGSVVALDDVDLAVEQGTIRAVVGGDGAGKTTLLRVLAGLDLGQTGRVRLPPRGRIGFVPSDGGFFGDLTVWENAEFTAGAYGLKAWQARARDLLESAGLMEFTGRLASRLSGGQKRKLAGSLALLPRPDLVVLDEVTTGVDPVSRVGLWRLVASAAASGAGVVVSTTYFDEAARAHRLTVMHEGRVLLEGTPDEIVDSVPGSVVESAAPANRALAWRHGRYWREWLPDSTGNQGRRSTIEDAAIVAELQSRSVTS